jgi:hypothetical protein
MKIILNYNLEIFFNILESINYLKSYKVYLDLNEDK